MAGDEIARELRSKFAFRGILGCRHHAAGDLSHMLAGIGELAPQEFRLDSHHAPRVGLGVVDARAGELQELLVLGDRALERDVTREVGRAVLGLLVDAERAEAAVVRGAELVDGDVGRGGDPLRWIMVPTLPCVGVAGACQHFHSEDLCLSQDPAGRSSDI